MMSNQLSRRQFLQRAAVGGAAVAVATILAACGGSSPTATPAVAATARPTSGTTTGAATAAPAATAASTATSAPGATGVPAGSAIASGATTPAGSAAAAATSAPVKLSGNIEFWSRETQENGARQPLIQQRLAAFDKANGTTSKAQFLVFQESVQKTQAALAANAPPDLGEQGPDVALGFAAAGNLLPIDDVFNGLGAVPATRRGSVRDVQRQRLRRPVVHRDARPLLPQGFAGPGGGEAADKLAGVECGGEGAHEGGGSVRIRVRPGDHVAGSALRPPRRRRRGQLARQRWQGQREHPEFKAALQFFSDLYTSGSMPKALPTYKQADTDQLFALKKIAMYWTNGSILSTLKTAAPDTLKTLGAIKTPPKDASGTSRSFLGGFQLFVFKQGKNTAGGKELLKYLFDPDWYADYVQKTNGAALPTMKAVAAKDTYQSDPNLKTLVDQQQTAIRYGGPVYGNAPYLGEAEGKLLFSQPVINVLTGKSTVDTALATMDTEVKKLAKQA